MIESTVTRSCLSYLGSLPHVKLWRNHVGKVIFQSGRPCDVGIPGEGGADYLGFIVENGVAVFLSVEFKRLKGGRKAEKQKEWRDFVLSHGGRSVFISSLAEAKELFPTRCDSATCGPKK